MLHTISFTKTRFVLLLISIISLSALAFTTYAQEEPPQKSQPHQVVITAKPQVAEIEENQYTIRFEVQNNTSEHTSIVLYGVTLLQTDEEKPSVIDAKAGGFASLASGDTQEVSIDYEIPIWLSGEYELYATLYADNEEVIDTELVDTLLLTGETDLEIEIIRDSCLFNYQDGTKAPLDAHLYIPDNPTAGVECFIINHTDTEQTVVPEIIVQNPPFVGMTLYTKEMAPVSLPAQSAVQVTFELPPIPQTGTYGVILDVGGTLVSNNVYTVGLTHIVPPEESVDEGTKVATRAEANMVLYVIAILLSLMVLLAVLVYMRKSKESLQDMHYPEN